MKESPSEPLECSKPRRSSPVRMFETLALYASGVEQERK